MTLEGAIGLTAAMMALAFVQQSAEHLRPAARRAERWLFVPRLVLSLLLFAAVAIGHAPPPVLLLALVANHVLILPFFNGPYNGGADRMSLLILLCVTATTLLPEVRWREAALGYLAIQLLLSYAIAGWVKIANPAWRGGETLRDVFLFSAYPAGENVRRLADRPRLLFAAGWAVMLFELAFPFAMLSRPALVAALVVAALFHLANACLFGLNRFFWIWLCAYPSILWLQDRVIG
ncbi:HTTM domain-containing protein [Sphingomonas adhaesiva]|uniref:HTTM domain-containing protein n=1 Tax=Sphingomonas adhaesiva TaxID=28212 RepID=UPI002FF8B99E